MCIPNPAHDTPVHVLLLNQSLSFHMTFFLAPIPSLIRHVFGD